MTDARSTRAKPKRSEPPAGDTATRILDAAEALFCERGFAGVSVGDVAERAGSRKPLVFYHWESKEALFGAVLGRYYDAHRRALEGALAAGGDVRSRMHGLVAAYLDFMVSNVRYARLVQTELSNPETHPLVEKSFRPLHAFALEVLSEVAPREGPAAARQLFVTFSGAVVGWCAQAPLLGKVWKEDPLGERLLDERRAHVHWLVDLVLSDLGVPAPRPERRETPRSPAARPRRAR